MYYSPLLQTLLFIKPSKYISFAQFLFVIFLTTISHSLIMSITTNPISQEPLPLQLQPILDIDPIIHQQNYNTFCNQQTTNIEILNYSYFRQIQDDHLQQNYSLAEKSSGTTKLPSKQQNWFLNMKQIDFLYFKVCEFLSIQDLMELQFINSRFLSKTKRAVLQSAVRNSNMDMFWSAVTNFPTLQRTHSHQYQILGVNYDQESQHSRDLDRTFLLEDCEIIENNRLKLDRILRALTKKGLYFQGLNYIVSAFLTCHPEQNSYWYTRYILHKVGFHNNISKLSDLLKLLQNMMKYHVPELYTHFQYQGLTIEYFSARWFISLYSYDTSVQLMMKLWQLLVLSDENMIVCFTICLFKKLQPMLLQLEEEDLNILLKTKLKEVLNGVCQQQLLLETIGLFTKQFSDLSFGFESAEMQENPCKNVIYL